MNILVTGTTGLAYELSQAFDNDHVVCVSKSTGHDINHVDQWGIQFGHMDMLFNCAYHGTGQLKVLEFFFDLWKNDTSKKIITIGSRVVSYPRSERTDEYWSYKLNKQSLQLAHDLMLPSAKCDMKIINSGPIDTAMIRHLDMPKFNPKMLSDKIKNIVHDSTIKRVDLWI